MDLLLSFILLGCLFGSLSGLIPGIGNTIVMMMLFPFLLSTDNIYGILVFYIALLSIGQYTGSITSTVFSVPGETSSFPAVKEGHALFRQGLGALSISGCAIGSFIGSLLAVSFVLFISGYLHQFTFLYSTKFLSSVLIVVLVFLIFSSYNKWYINLFLCLIGYFLATLGTGALNEHQTFTFGIDDLLLGIPLFTVITWLYVFPEIIRNWNIKIPKIKQLAYVKTPLKVHIYQIIRNFGSIIRGSVFGFFLGLTPYLTTIIASNVTYNIEVWLRKQKHKYDNNGDIGSLLAAETANNSAALSSLLPLLLLGIPITSSEAILSEILTAKGHFFDIDNFYDIFIMISYCLVIINIIGLIIAWPMAKYFAIFYVVDIRLIYSFVIAFCIAATIYLGWYNNALIYYVCVSVIFAMIGYFFRRFDTMPLVIVFMMQDGIEENLIRLIYYM